MERLPTHRNLTFSERELLRYIKSVRKHSKLEEEILATLAYKHNFQKNVLRSALYIGFPVKEGSDKDLNRVADISPEAIGDLIHRFVEENSPIDSILVSQKAAKPSFQKALQIKLFGKYDNGSNIDDFHAFIAKFATYAPNNIALIIFSERPFDFDGRNTNGIFAQNNFPFKEVVLISGRPKGKGFNYTQIRPPYQKK